MADAVIQLQNVSKSFAEQGQHTQILQGIDLEIRQGELLCLIGPSGCGKSTLLRIMSGLDRRFAGQLQRDSSLKIGLVFQNFGLFGWLTVEQNIAFGLRMTGQLSEGEIRARVAKEMAVVGLTGYGDRHPKELSGGMKQRVGLARALVVEPDILFMDEPFSALDAFTAKTLRADLLKIWGERKITVVMVTHLVEEASELADRVVVLSKRPGKIKKIIDNDLPRPRDHRSQPFYDLADQLEALVTKQD